MTEAIATPGALKRLADEGVSVWLDDLSRSRITSGGLASLVDGGGVVGVTTNPSIFQAAIGSGEGYEEQLTELAVRGVTVDEAVRMMTTADVRAAADVLRDVYTVSDGRDGRVSIEVDPRLAHRTEATVAEAKQLAWLVDRPNVMIKIPATRAGLPGLDLSEIHSVASFFVSRVDSEIDKRLTALGTDEALALKGRAALANARLAYEAYEEVFGSGRWQALAGDRANKQRPLWASTGVKDPAYKDTLYVDELVAPGTVNTMPEATLRATADHGEITGDTVTGGYDRARADLAAVERLGVSYDEVVQQLEDEGVAKFETAWQELLDAVTESLKSKGVEA
ncbi:transaldolase [Streptomyces sp. NPDC047869]|uniref:transaldolase n=1 Tax=Streptomyces sp. NPDC047869 TaxID=3154709 RepID=UPI0034569DB0